MYQEHSFSQEIVSIMLDVVLCTQLNNNMVVATVVVVLHVDEKATLLSVVEMEVGKMRIRSRLNKGTGSRVCNVIVQM